MDYEPGVFHPNILDQDDIWVDIFGRTHQISYLDRDWPHFGACMTEEEFDKTANSCGMWFMYGAGVVGGAITGAVIMLSVIGRLFWAVYRDE